MLEIKLTSCRYQPLVWRDIGETGGGSGSGDRGKEGCGERGGEDVREEEEGDREVGR